MSIRLPWLWVLISGVHMVAAAIAWRMLPHGFDLEHPRFWINQVLPVVIAGVGVGCVIAIWRRWTRLAALAMLCFVGVHIAMGAGWLGVFPLTGTRPAQLAIASAVVLSACAFASLRNVRGATWAMTAGAAIGFVAGSAVPWSQRAADPATHPFAGELAADRERDFVQFDVGPVRVELMPRLTFISRSPDRGWTSLATAEQRIGRAEPSSLRVVSSGENVMRIEAETLLAQAVYSHLNSYCQIAVRGHARLFVAFSPAPDKRIEVTRSEYPTGLPARFAYVDAARVFHVVEAESGEKGPFTELARGPLPPDATLGITLFDEERPIARIDFADFAAQASTQISPTAGWGVPENAIEFSLRPGGAAFLYLTLAGTSVGRGWDSVGHAAGLYRNRITLRALDGAAVR